MAWLTSSTLSSVAASVAATGAAPGGASDPSALQPPSAGARASASADATATPAARLSDPSPSLAWRGLEATNSSLNSLDTSADADLPLVSHIWTADPAGHVFNGTLWVYTSHDEDERPRGAAEGADQFNMRDYRAFSFAHPKSRGRDEGVLLSLQDIPWASRQLWAPGAPHAHTSNRPGYIRRAEPAQAGLPLTRARLARCRRDARRARRVPPLLPGQGRGGALPHWSRPGGAAYSYPEPQP